MKYLLIFALVTFALAEESDLTKRGVSKSSSINALPNNGHQKPDQLNYANYKQSLPSTQTPLYPLAPSSYSSEPQSSVSHQPTYNFLPAQHQIVPVSVMQQQFSTPKYQLIAMKGSNGQMHLTLIPQSLYLGPQQYVSPSLLPLSQPLVSNHLTSSQIQTTQSSNLHGHNYVTPQPATYSTAGAGIPQVSQSAFYQPQQSSFGYSNPLLSQPSTMFIYTQPAPQLYNNYASSASNLLYSPIGQQLLNYYQSNPQAKNQLLYGNSAYQQGVNSYQSPLNSGEYEKPTQVPVQSNAAPQKNENDNNSLNTNEYVSQPEEQFRPIPSYGSRGPTNYKN